MSALQPSFIQRIRLLEGAGQAVAAEADRCNHAAAKRLLVEAADTILTEVEMMKLANRRWQEQRQAEAFANAKTAPKGAAITS